MSKVSREEMLEAKAQEIRDGATRKATERLSRGNLRLQNGAYATQHVWEQRREKHAQRIKNLNETLGA